MSYQRENLVNAGAYSGDDSFRLDDYEDSFLLSLLTEEIQDDQISGITEGLHLQRTLLSSLMVMDSDQNSGDPLLPDNHEDSFILSLLSEEIQDDQISVITEGLHMQKTLLSSSRRKNVTGDKMSPGAELLHAHSAKEEANCSYKICELCAIQEEEIWMISVSGCRHYFCYQCLNKYVSAGEFDRGDNRSMKCPAENCCCLMEYDYCVALMLQYTLDKKADKLFIS